MEIATSDTRHQTGDKGSDDPRFDPFSPNYQTARARFLESAGRLGWESKSYPLEVSGPAGETLSVDVAISPGKSSKALLVSSGLHGVEGFFGSAVQLAWMERCFAESGSSVRQVLIHAQNPYGFAYRRRVDQDNVDLNRNFLLEGQTYAGSPAGYGALDRFLNPKKPPSRWEPFTLKALALIARHGKANLERAIAIGQYEYPEGLFFGGKQPSRLSQLLSEHLEEWLAGSRDVVHLDLHTGLGAWGDCRVLVDYPLSPALLDRLKAWFGQESLNAYTDKEINYQAQGGLGRWLSAMQTKRDYSFAFVELGTYSPIQILKGLRAENQAFHWSDSSKADLQKAGARLKELFCPASPEWRRTAIEKSLNLLTEAARGLTAAR